MKTNIRTDRIASLARRQLAIGSEPFGYRRATVPARLATAGADRRAAPLSGVVRSFASCHLAWIERVRFAADLRWFAHANVKLLAGGRDGWVRAKRPLATAIRVFVPSPYRSAEQDAPTRVFHGDVLIALAGQAERSAASAAADQP
jgi:hypothetical protein